MTFKCHRQHVGSSCRVTFNNRVEQHKMKCVAEFLLQKCCPQFGKLWTVGKNKTRKKIALVLFLFLSFFFLLKEHRSQPHFTCRNPFTHSGCCQATQLVTAWITLHEGLGQTIRLEIQFCATSNVRRDPSDAG